MKTLHVDPFCGAAGDMLVGALLDAGAPFDQIERALNSLKVDGLRVTAAKVNKRGIMATQFTVHAEGHHHPHRNLADIVVIINGGDLPQTVKEAAIETFRRLAECEAEIHGTSIDAIHFHEVGALDSIADIVAAHLALHLLQVDTISCAPLNVGSGTVKMSHGVLPVPAPATALLLKNVPIYAADVDAELVTPTGAAVLMQCVGNFGALPAMRVQQIGYGSGTRELPDRPNVLRVFFGESVEPLRGAEQISVVEADIDDMNPELFPPLINELLEKGARDVFLTPLVGKKGRPAHLLTMLCDEHRLGSLIPIIFAGSTTFGVRIRREERVCLDREWKSVATEWGDVKIKIGKFDGKLVSLSPEFEDCKTNAELHDVPVRLVYQSAQAAAVKGEFKDA